MSRTEIRWAAAGLALVASLLASAAVTAEPDVRLRPIPPRQGKWVVEITAVEPGGPGYRAGLEVRDRILEVDGVRVTSLPHLRRLLMAVDYSARLTILNWRTGRDATVHVYPEDGRIGIDARMVLVLPPRRYPY
jgi:S1-C subfamily serine protease